MQKSKLYMTIHFQKLVSFHTRLSPVVGNNLSTSDLSFLTSEYQKCQISFSRSLSSSQLWGRCTKRPEWSEMEGVEQNKEVVA